jgi:hypothetical protein
LCVLERLDDVRDDGLDGVGVGRGDNGLGGGLGSDLDGDNLVTDGVQDRGEELDEVGLDGGRDVGVLGNGADGIEGALAGDGILLAAKLLLQQVDGPGVLSERALAGEGQRGSRKTHLVGASASSMSPLMKVAMALAAAVMSSCSLETVNLAMSSSRALRAFEFSDLMAAAS